MIRILFVGDGERDAVTVPPIVERLIGVPVKGDTRAWVRLHQAGIGYSKKLLYAFRQARDAGCGAVVATFDSDSEKRGNRLRSMQKARMYDREQHAPIPTALGEAVPHGEAWLLDDAVAVRKALRLSGDAPVPSVRKEKHPRKVLERLLGESQRKGDRPLAVWAEIAGELEASRCVHADTTGFGAFVDEVQKEVRPLAAQRKDDG